ncbi:MAG: DUF3365 domain-containing protein [Pseudomonadota bacterium]
MSFTKAAAALLFALAGNATLAAPLPATAVAGYLKATIAAEKRAYDAMISSRVKLHGCAVSDDPKKGGATLPTTARFQHKVLETATNTSGPPAEAAQAQQLKNLLAGTGPATLSPDDALNLQHRYIAASRSNYATEVIVPAQTSKCARPGAMWAEDDGLPLPAQFTRAVGAQVQQGGTFAISLISEWPTNSQNGARTDFEKKALKAVQSKNPTFGDEVLGGKRYRSAAYPDFAISTSCVECHNNLKESPKRDFTLGSVMGAVIIRLLQP